MAALYSVVMPAVSRPPPTQRASSMKVQRRSVGVSPPSVTPLVANSELESCVTCGQKRKDG